MLADVLVLGMGGLDLMDKLRAAGLVTKVLFMSSHLDDARVHYGILGTGLPFLEKPLTVASLADKIDEMLDDAPTVRTPSPQSRAAPRV